MRRGHVRTLLAITLSGAILLASLTSPAQAAKPFGATADYSPTSGVDTTSGVTVALSATDLTRLSASDDSRKASDAAWPTTGAYDETRYIEVVFTPNLDVTMLVSAAIITHEYRRSGVLTAAKLEVYEADNNVWHDETINLPSASNSDLSQDIDVSAYINSPADINGLKVRFLAYRSTVASITTSHDLFRLRVTTQQPTATFSPTPSFTLTPSQTETPTLTSTPSETPTPSQTATPSQTLTPSQTTVPPVVVINELVTDPQRDWNDSSGGNSVLFDATYGTGSITDTDEWIELYNAGSVAVDLQSGSGWSLSITDSGTDTLNFLTSPGTATLVFSHGGSLTHFQAGEYLVIGNPPGAMNNDVVLVLTDGVGNTVDSVEVGDVAGVGNSTDGAPDGITDGNASSDSDEAIARTPNAADTGDHPADFEKQTATIGASNTLPATNTPTPTLTPTPTATPTLTPTAFPARSVVISEVMWMGTVADSNDEWIELCNTTSADISLTGWTLSIDDGTPPEDTVINLGGTIAASQCYLMERTDDSTVSDVAADFIYTGSLSNDGRILNLRDSTATSIDTANGNGGAWPAGDSGSRASMERVNALAPDADDNWVTNFGHVTNGRDAASNAIRGTPRQANSAQVPTPTPTSFVRHTTIRLNEVLPNPGTSKDWESLFGLTRGADEYIEIVNIGDQPVDLSHWMLDDGEGGSSPFVIAPGFVLNPGDLWFWYSSETGLAFNDGGDSARLLYPDGSVVDEIAWASNMKDDHSISRIVSGLGAWEFNWQPTPGMLNRPHAVGSKYGPKPTPVVIGIRSLRSLDDGAWVTLVGNVIGPYPLFGARVVYLQDGSGGGIALYLGSGTWPPMVAGQAISAAGYLRTRNGERELYVKNPWQFAMGTPMPPPTPALLNTSDINESNEGSLVTITGTVVRLEANAIWLDDGTGAARVFFRSSIGFNRPHMRRGQVWSATGIVGEFTTQVSRAVGHRVLIRFTSDLVMLTDSRIRLDRTPTATPLPEESATPTALPDETDTPTPAP